MPRIAGIDIPANKKVCISLTYIFGIGRTQAVNILNEAGVDVNKKSAELTEGDIAGIRKIIEDKHVVEGDLRKEIAMNIKRLGDLVCYRGMRHKKGLPVRGQNTQSNARTRKGPRKTIAGKKSVKSMK